MQPSSEVEVWLEKGELRLSPVRPRWKLSELLAGVRKKNLHAEVHTGPALGREAW